MITFPDDDLRLVETDATTLVHLENKARAMLSKRQLPWPAIDAKWPVIAPPKVLAQLLNKVDDLDTPGLTAYAKGIGIKPPEVEGSEQWPIAREYDEADRFICLVWADPSEDDNLDDDADWPTAQPA